MFKLFTIKAENSILKNIFKKKPHKLPHSMFHQTIGGLNKFNNSFL